MVKNWISAVCIGAAVLSAGCEKETATTTGTPPAATTSPGASGSPSASTPPAQGHHNRIPIGQVTQAGLTRAATQDAPVAPGDDAAFDVVITGGKPKTVRFWVGTEDATGSVKAKAEEETTDNWHTHAEVPDPLPPGSRFWVEVEPPAGEIFTASFELKMK